MLIPGTDEPGMPASSADELDRGELASGGPPLSAGLTSLLAESYNNVISAATVGEVMRRASEAARQLLGNDVGWYAKRHGDELRITAHSGLRGPQMVEQWTVPVGRGIGGRVVDRGQTVVVRDYRHDRRRTTKVKSLLDREGIVSGVVAPVPIGPRFVGAIYSGSREQRSFSPQAVAAVTALGGVVGATLGKIDTIERMRARVGRMEEQGEQLRFALELSNEISDEMASSNLSSGLEVLADHLKARIELRNGFGELLVGVGDPGLQQLSADVPIKVDRRSLGHLLIFSATLSSSQQAILQLVSKTVLLRLLRDQAVVDTELRLNTRFFDGLLIGDERDAQQIAKEATLLGFDLHNRFVVCIGRRQSSSVPGEVPSTAGDLGPEAVTLIQKQARALDQEPIVALRSGFVVVLLDAAARDDGSVAEDVLRLLHGCDIDDLVAGVGSRCTEPGDYPAAYREGRFALEIACERGEESSVSTIGEMGLLGLFAHATDRDVLAKRARATVAPLLACDADYLITTLRSYFAHNRNLERTAADLFVHVNTVRHRLSKAEELLGIDLKDGEQRFLLELAVRVQGVMDALETNAEPEQ